MRLPPHIFLLHLRTLIYALGIIRIWTKVSIPWGHVEMDSCTEAPWSQTPSSNLPSQPLPIPLRTRAKVFFLRAGGLVTGSLNRGSSQKPWD